MSIILSPDDAGYPSGMALVELHGDKWARPAPPLYLRGRLPERPGVAIVGTREPCPEALSFARRLAKALVGDGWAIWSGGAKGIDLAAHEGALSAGGPTVWVGAGGFDRPYPEKHAALLPRIVAAGGAALSTMPDGVPWLRHLFHRRNLVLAALTKAMVVVQASRPPSGSLHAASAARRVGKPVFAVPGAPWSDATAGSALLLEEGVSAVARIETTVSRLRRLRGGLDLPPPPPAPRRAEASAPLDEDAVALLALLDDRPRGPDWLCEQSGLDVARVQRALLLLLLAGEVAQVSGRYRRSARLDGG